MTPVSALALEVIYPGSQAEVVARYAAPLNAAMERYDIVTPERQSAFLAQVLYESAGLTRLEENLNYSAEALVRVWPTRFTPELAEGFARQPQKIANSVYANRMGNGDEASGDGWRYRGRGPIQITGKDNYRSCSASILQASGELLKHPELLLDPAYGALSAAWFWWSRGLNELADDGKFREITKAINGGYTGAVERGELWKTAKQILI